MTIARRAVVAAALAGLLLASSSLASPSPRYVYRYVAFVTLTGHGTVRSVPKGIRCPGACRALFPRGTHLRLIASPGTAVFDSRWCHGTRHSCALDLVSTHDCVGGACPVGAFGVRVSFPRR